MSYDYSISLNGIQTALRTLEQAAQRIAVGNAFVKQINNDKATSSLNTDYSDSVSFSGTLDYVRELLAVNQAKIAVKANARFISLQQELERETLNLFA